MIEAWCKQGSWAICKRCGCMSPRHLKEIDTRRVAPVHITKCNHCSGVRPAWIPRLSDWPNRLLGLTAAVVEALRPIDVDCGREAYGQYGYRRHASMIRFAWCDQDVLDKIERLPTEDEYSQAERAYEYLMHNQDSLYDTFVQKHRKWRRKFPNAEREQRKRPLIFIEEVGLECALWPNYYFNAEMCETVERATDNRRIARTDRPEAGQDEADWGAELDDIGRHSVKRHFMRKVFGPVPGFGKDWEQIHFVYDLALWSDLGGKRNKFQGTPMRVLLKSAPWTGGFWKQRHWAGIDMMEQCGFFCKFWSCAWL